MCALRCPFIAKHRSLAHAHEYAQLQHLVCTHVVVLRLARCLGGGGRGERRVAGLSFSLLPFHAAASLEYEQLASSRLHSFDTWLVLFFILLSQLQNSQILRPPAPAAFYCHAELIFEPKGSPAQIASGHTVPVVPRSSAWWCLRRVKTKEQL